MSHLALYRAFRPKTFDGLIGQDHVTKTLINQIKTDRVGHAYLFCGARGTGKTSAAKIFAKAINCLSPENGSPCGKCEACKKLENPSNLDIVEMDAASNNKVENIRDLRDKIQYPPVAGRYKVYIIDEVHMLTTEAFNALLKTLEEPPKHAVFILATTEAHKLPATILSRCLRFDFKLIPTAEIARQIASIYDGIGKKYQKEAVTMIAKAGEGSMRDALSVADICVSYGDGVLTYDDVLEVLGTSDRNKIEELVADILKGDTGAVLSAVDELTKRGKSVGVLNGDVCSCIRDLLVVKTCANCSEILSVPEDKLNDLKKITANCDTERLLRCSEIFSETEGDLKYSSHPKIVFETAALKAATPQNDYSVGALLARVSALEKTFAELRDGASSGLLKVDSGAKPREGGGVVSDTEKANTAKYVDQKSFISGTTKQNADNAQVPKTDEKNVINNLKKQDENAQTKIKKVENVKIVGNVDIVENVEKSPSESINASFEDNKTAEQTKKIKAETAALIAEKSAEDENQYEVEDYSGDDIESLSASVPPENDEGSFYSDAESENYSQSEILSPRAEKLSARGDFSGSENISGSKRAKQTDSANEVNGGDDQSLKQDTVRVLPQMQEAGSVPDSKIWGLMLRQMRIDKEIMMWVACQDLSVKTENGKLVVSAPGSSEYEFISKPENLGKIKKYATQFGAVSVSVASGKGGAIEEDGADKSEARVRKLFEGENLIVK